MAKNVHLVLVNCLREACPGTVVRITDRVDITSAVYHGHKALKSNKSNKTFYKNHANHWALAGLNLTQDIVEITQKSENIEIPPKATK